MLTYVRQNVRRLKTDRKGLETIEYAILAAIVVAVVIVGYRSIFDSVGNTTNNIAAALNNINVPSSS